jgi:hypothetical protein
VQLAAVSLLTGPVEPVREALAPFDVPGTRRRHPAGPEQLDVLALDIGAQRAGAAAGMACGAGLRRGGQALVTDPEDLPRVRRALSEQPGRRISMLMTVRASRCAAAWHWCELAR